MPSNIKLETTHHLENGAIVVAKRPNTNNWQMRIKRPDTGKWEIKSTKTDNLEQAKEIAKKRLAKLVFHKEENIPLIEERRLIEAVTHYEKQLIALQGTGAEKPIHETYLQCINKWIKPFFAHTKLSDLDNALLKDYDAYLRRGLGREPAKSTFNHHNVVLRGIFDVAVDKKWISRADLPLTTVKGKGRAANRRPAFEKKEWNRITKLLAGKWLTGSKNWTSNYKRQVLRIYVLVLANTGMRPGEESLNLKWKDVNTYRYTDAQFEEAKRRAPKNEEVSRTAIRFDVAGKTSQYQTEGYRRVIARHNVGRWLQELKAVTKRTDKNDYLFCMPDGTQITDLNNMFKAFLRTHDLLYDAQGNQRVLYSLRHMYGTIWVQRGLGYEVLAKQMGTSAAIIQMHYDHAKIEEFAAQLTF